jgi:diguanylate cyclase (GGDEF)-like protein/PAS domain S-box-containing protein
MGAGAPAAVSKQLAFAASASVASRFKVVGPVRLIIVCAVLLSMAIITGAYLFLFSLHDRVRVENERILSNTAFILAKQLEQVFTTAESVETGIINQIAVLGIITADDLDHQLSRYEFHLKLHDSAAGMPYVGSLTVINALGRVINLSREWPVPDISTTDRDFFKALRSDPNLTSFVSEPVRNRATGTWVMHLARKISGPNNEFLGLITAAIELQSIQKTFSDSAPEPGSGITLFRRDGTLLARAPQIDSNIGRRSPTAVALKLTSTADHGVGVTEGVNNGDIRMIAAHRVGSYPIVVTAGKTIAAIFTNWWRTAAYIIGISVLSIVTIASVALLFIKIFKNYQALVKVRAEQEKAEQLQEKNLRFDAAINNMSQGLCMFDGAQRLIVCNEHYLQMYGLSSEVVKPGVTLFELVKHRAATGSFGNDPHEYCTKIHDQIANGQLASQIVELSDGRVIHMVNQPMADGGWIATHEEITEQRRAEQERDRNRTFLDLIIENAPVPIFVKEANERRYVLVNRAGEEFWGSSRAEMIGKTSYEVFPKEEADRITARDEELLQSDQPLFDERQIRTPRNGVRNIVSKRLIVHNDGKPQFVVGVIEDVTERKRAGERIAHLAHHDALTDLPNRTAFNECFAATLDSAARAGEQFAILSIDLDRFKEANDTYGHTIGDALLREAARHMQAIAGGAFLARLGGDEFMLIVTDGPQPAAVEALAERLIAAFENDMQVEGYPLRLGLSIGAALYPTDGADAKTLMINADAALYRAKAECRGSVRFFEVELAARLRERRDLQSDLRSALDRGNLFLHYQPQQKMTGETIGFEALVRWQCLRRGVVAPRTFIPIAEESNLIIPVGEWVLREACREAATWSKPLTIAVNISPIQFRHGDLPRFVHSILLETGLAPGRLELEITEGVLIDDFSRAVSILRRLKSLGVQIAMDDFGSGYSSLSYLHAFPFDKIKIDRTFVSDLEDSHHSLAIVRAVIGLGHSLNVPILAEGVETEAQFAILMQEGCDEVQGYLKGRPLPIEDYARLVGRKANAKQNYAVTG